MLGVGIAGWALIALTLFGIVPLYPDIARDLRASPDQLGGVVGIAPLVSALLQIPCGVLADALPVRRFVITGITLVATAGLARSVAPNVQAFAFAQILAGAAIAIFQAGSITAVANAYPTSGRATAVGSLFSAFSVGTVASILLFGLVGAQIGWRSTTVLIALVPLLVLPFAFTMPDPPRAPAVGTLSNRFTQTLRFLVQARPLMIAATATLTLAATMSLNFVIPFLLRDQHFDSAAISLLFLPIVIGSIAGAPLLGYLTDRHGVRLPLSASLFAAATGIGCLLVLGPSPAVVVSSLATVGLCLGGVPALLQTQAAKVAQGTGVGPGAAMGGMRLASSLGPLAGPALGGVAYVWVGASAALAGALVSLALAGLVSLMVTRPINKH